MTQEEITQLADKDLEEKIIEEKENLNRLKVNHAVSPLENPLKIRSNRKIVARLQTERTKRKNSKQSSEQ